MAGRKPQPCYFTILIPDTQSVRYSEESSIFWVSGIQMVSVKKNIFVTCQVQEDQDFLSNFILTEEAFVEYDKKVEENSGKSSSSLFGDILLFSGSMAAVAGTILFLSERTRYSGDLKSDHFKSGNIQNPDFLKVRFQMVWFAKGRVRL